MGLDRKNPADLCCDDMRRAFQPGTDNEMYGSVAFNIGDQIYIGCDLPEISVCPWCGRAPLKQESAS